MKMREKNMFEEDFFVDQLQGWEKRFKHSYTKITNIDSGRKENRIPNMKVNDINVIVYNFVDMFLMLEQI